ncbi:hypothetical protein XENTR_v10008769 [Xenopus tropicalis]|nr:hypothetical protein XENTR_v10008769 [Xenopus tropicalis]
MISLVSAYKCYSSCIVQAQTIVTSDTFCSKERPREFLIKQLEKLKYARLSDVDYPCLFDDSNLDAIFGILDPAGQGYITGTQYMEALKTLGIDVRNVEEPGGKITLELFKHGMRIQLKSACATFKS